MANELTFSESLRTSLIESKGSLPRDLNIDRFVANAVALLNEKPELTKFAREHGTTQIKLGLMKAAILGLDAMNKEVYLIPFSSQIQFMPDYRGNVKLCKKYSQRKIKDIYSKLVREGDEFEELIVDGHPSINFKAKPFNDGPVIGAFAVCLYEDGGMEYDTMSIADLENTRNSSKAKNSPAWTRFTGEMYKKTVLHRMCKHITLDFESSEQLSLYNEDMEDRTMSVKDIHDAEVSANANAEEFVIEGEAFDVD